jgi:hypothetical protein
MRAPDEKLRPEHQAMAGAIGFYQVWRSRTDKSSFALNQNVNYPES